MHGATYNDAIQVVVMAIALIVPTMALHKKINRNETQTLVETIHGWKQVNGKRYANASWLIILVMIWIPIAIWALKPWK